MDNLRNTEATDSLCVVQHVQCRQDADERPVSSLDGGERRLEAAAWRVTVLIRETMGGEYNK